MKLKLYSFLIVLIFVIGAYSQVPERMSYQAVIRNSIGQLVANHAVGMRISILQGSATGTPVYVETQITSTNANGLATIEIGGGTIITGSFAEINWATGTYFIKTETDPTGGSSYTITGTNQILSVPYALYAKTAASAVDAVTLTGDQTITGNKTFTKDILVNGLTVGKAGGGVLTNTALGISALKSNTTGPNNTSLGSESLFKNATGYSNTSVGYRSLYSSTTGGRNTAIGDSTLFSNTTGGDNTATGAYALHLNTSGYWNTGNGYQSLFSNTTGIGNTATGYKAFRSGKTGNYNTAVGYHAGYSNTAGSNNVFIGSSAGYYETGSNRLFIDNQQRANETDARNKALIYGIFSSDPGSQVLTFNGNVGIGTLTPSNKLEVNGNVRILNGNNVLLMGADIDAGDVIFQSSAGSQLARIYAYYNSLVLTTQANNTGNLIITQTGETSVTQHRIIEVADPVNAQDAATKAYVDAILNKLSATGAILADADGNIYSTVRIGSQVWMAENLKTTKYKDGSSIPLVTDSIAWANLKTPGYCWHKNEATNKNKFGALYNWYTVQTGKLCPAEWHVPTDVEWATLENYLIINGYNYNGTTIGNLIGKALASSTLWKSSANIGAVGNTDYPTKRNATGFSALPGSYRSYYYGSFGSIGSDGCWWSATNTPSNKAWYLRLYYYNPGSHIGDVDLTNGFSVRCLRD